MSLRSTRTEPIKVVAGKTLDFYSGKVKTLSLSESAVTLGAGLGLVSGDKTAYVAGPTPFTTTTSIGLLTLSTALTTAAAGSTTITVNNSDVVSTSIIEVTLRYNGTTGNPVVKSIVPSTGSFVITITNTDPSGSLNGGASGLQILYKIL